MNTDPEGNLERKLSGIEEKYTTDNLNIYQKKYGFLLGKLMHFHNSGILAMSFCFFVNMIILGIAGCHKKEKEWKKINFKLMQPIILIHQVS